MAVDTQQTPHRVTLDIPLRYHALTRDQASIRKQTGYLEECGVEDLSLGNAVAWGDAWDVNQVHVLQLRGVKDCWVRRVRSFDPPTAPTSGFGANDHLQSGGILVRYAKRVTVADSTLTGAQNNGELEQPRRSSSSFASRERPAREVNRALVGDAALTRAALCRAPRASPVRRFVSSRRMSRDLTCPA